jgi:four helix bundle protein
MQDFRRLTVWQKAHQLTLVIYKVTRSFPDEEKFGLISQMRRSSSFIPTNIAEGCVRPTDNDFARFLYISLGSTSELEYQLLLAHD